MRKRSTCSRMCRPCRARNRAHEIVLNFKVGSAHTPYKCEDQKILESGLNNRRLATILSIDVVGYSKLMQTDASGLLAALNSVFRSIVKPQVVKANGRIVKLLGDGAIVEFPSAYQALVAAAEIQTHMRDVNAPYTYDKPLFLRIGVHVGDIIDDGNDIFGDGVNIAARLQTEAASGGVLLSSTVADLAGGDLPVKLRREGARSLKNISKPIETLSIDFSDQASNQNRERAAQSLTINFCTSSDAQRLAWTSVGEGKPIVKAPNWIGHLEADWRNPGTVSLMEALSQYRRLVYFDSRGNGLSDWEMENISFDLLVDDLEAVFDAAGVDRAPIMALSQGGAIAVAFAVRAPERVSGIVMLGSYPVGRAARKEKGDQARAEAMQAMMSAGWDEDYPSLRDLIAETIIPGASREQRQLYAQEMRGMISPENLGRYRNVVDSMDVTELLPKVQAPCLVLHSKGDRMQPVEQGRKMAAGIPNSRFITYDSNNHLLPENDPCWPKAEREIQTFLDSLN